MAQANVFPAFINVGLDPNSAGFRDFRSAASEAGDSVKRQFERDMAEVQKVIGNAVKMPAGASGGLNLDTASMRQAAVEADRRAKATRDVARAAEEAAIASRDLSQQTSTYVQAARAAAVAAEQEARDLAIKATTYERLQREIDQTAVAEQRLAGQTNVVVGTNRRLADSQRQVSQASIGVGQQLQDIGISLYSGQRAGVVFAQQLPQMAFALSMLEGSTNKTLARLGAFGTFLSGPWGLAVGLGVGALAMLISSLWESEKAMEAMQVASDNTGAAQSTLGQMFDLTTGKITNNTQALRDNIYMQMVAMQQKAIIAKQAASERLGETGLGKTTAWERFSTRAMALGSPFASQAAELALARKEAAGRQWESLSRGVAQGGLSREEAGKILESQRKTMKSEDYFGLQDVLNRSYEERTATQAAKDMQAALGGSLPDALRKPAKDKPGKKKTGGSLEAEARAALALENAVDQASDSVARLRGQFDEAPKDIDKVAQATVEFDNILEEIKRRAAGGKLTGADKERDAQTKRLIEDAKQRLLPAFEQRPVNDRIKAGDKELQIQRLLLQGRDDEADKLALTQDLMRQLNVDTEEQFQTELKRRKISAEQLDLMYKQAEQSRENARIQQRMDRSVRSTRSQIDELGRAYSSIEQAVANLPNDARGALKDLVGNLRQQVNEIIARRITDSLFGNLFSKLEDEIRGKKPIDAATENYVASTVQATTALIDLTETFIYASGAMRGAANDNSPFGAKSGNSAVAQILKASSKSIADDPNAEIVVSGERGKSKINREQRAIADAMEKSSRSLRDIAKGALEGAFIGQTASSLVFGNKGSSVGSAVGGALGKVAGEALGKVVGGTLGKFAGPLGSIAGGLLGSVVGGLFTKTPRGFATIGGGADGKLAITGTGGNSNSAIKAGNQAAGATIDTLDKIAQMLGGTYDASKGSVSIGRSGDSWHVDTTGRGRLKKSQGGLDFDQDYEAAVRAATMDLIRDGVISGLRASTQRLIQQGKDLDASLQKALDFESVFQRLKEYRDPVGAALDTLDKEFTRLKGIFAEAGASAAEYADLEALYGLERAKAIEEAANRVTASLQSLFDDLTIGDNGRSLRDRLSAAQAAYDPLKARVMAGDKTAYDAYAEAAKSLLDIQRQLSGSQTPYFNLLDEITQLTKQRIDAEKNVISIAESRDTPFGPTGKANETYQPVVSAIQEGNDLLRQIGRLLAGASSGSGIRVDGFVTNSMR